MAIQILFMTRFLWKLVFRSLWYRRWQICRFFLKYRLNIIIIADSFQNEYFETEENTNSTTVDFLQLLIFKTQETSMVFFGKGFTIILFLDELEESESDCSSTTSCSISTSEDIRTGEYNLDSDAESSVLKKMKILEYHLLLSALLRKKNVAKRLKVQGKQFRQRSTNKWKKKEWDFLGEVPACWNVNVKCKYCRGRQTTDFWQLLGPWRR